MNEPKKIAIYARVSSERQDTDLSISAQLKALREYVQDLKALLEQSSIVEQKAFLKSFVEKIEVDSSEMKVIYTIPMLPDNPPAETVGILPFIHNGPP